MGLGLDKGATQEGFLAFKSKRREPFSFLKRKRFGKEGTLIREKNDD
jgi:hypothetical protein